jgi:hypothetical protein
LSPRYSDMYASHKTAQAASNPPLVTAISMWQCASLGEQTGKSQGIAE